MGSLNGGTAESKSIVVRQTLFQRVHVPDREDLEATLYNLCNPQHDWTATELRLTCLTLGAALVAVYDRLEALPTAATLEQLASDVEALKAKLPIQPSLVYKLENEKHEWEPAVPADPTRAEPGGVLG